MTLKDFFKTFHVFADAPNAVEKLRELILDFAASGKLLTPVQPEWQRTTLESVIELISGQHLLANEHNSKKKGIPYLTGPSDFGKLHPVPTRWTEHPKIVAQPGDILITVKGSGVGKTNLLVKEPTAIGRQLMAVRVTSADKAFVHLVLQRAAEHFQNAMSGIAIPGISREDILELRVVLPPLAEQKRIVARVNELMALCDRLEAQQKERDEKHAILARASLARFAEAPTPSNLNLLFHKSYTIPPADLRRCIYQAAFDGVLTSNPPDMPTGWVQRDIASLCVIEDGDRGSAYPKKKDFSESGYCVFLNTKNVRRHGFDFTTLEWISEEKHQELRKGILVRGTLFSPAGELSAILPITMTPFRSM